MLQVADGLRLVLEWEQPGRTHRVLLRLGPEVALPVLPSLYRGWVALIPFMFGLGARGVKNGEDYDLRIISLGAGVQSSALYRMAVMGEIGRRASEYWGDRAGRPRGP